MNKGHGVTAFTKTLKKYIDEGWQVLLVSDEETNKQYPYLNNIHNINLKPNMF